MSSLLAAKPKNAAQLPSEGPLPAWARRLQRLGLANVVAALLESNAGLGILGAQALHLGAPLLNGFLDQQRLQLAADSLEDPQEIQTFIQLLRGAK